MTLRARIDGACWASVWLLAASVGACETSSSSDANSPDTSSADGIDSRDSTTDTAGTDGTGTDTGGTDANGGACTLAVDDTIAVGEGAHALLAVTRSARVTTLEVASAPAGLVVAVEDGGVSVAVPYATKDTAVPAGGTLVIRGRCDDEVVEASVAVATRPLKWAVGPKWRSGVDGPVGREYGAIWMDGVEPNFLYVHGGFHYEPQQFTPSWDTWRLDLTSGDWEELDTVAPPELVGGRVAPLPGQRSVLLHGGFDSTNRSPARVNRLDYGTEPPTWTDLAVTGSRPGGDYTGAFVYDPVDDQYVHACGANQALGYHCKVYTMRLSETGVAWTKLAPEGEPPDGRNGFFFAMDVPNHRLVLFSGERGGTDWTPNLAQDTWALELDPPVRWVRLSGGEEPPLGRRNGAYLHDPVGNRLFVWGGTADGATTFPGLFVLSLERGQETWREVFPVGEEPPMRTSAMGTFDAAKNRFLVGFGNDNKVFADLWALEL